MKHKTIPASALCPGNLLYRCGHFHPVLDVRTRTDHPLLPGRLLIHVTHDRGELDYFPGADVSIQAFNWHLSVFAQRDIADSPLAKADSSAKRGDEGTIEDEFDDFVAVDFGKGAILCLPADISHNPPK